MLNIHERLKYMRKTLSLTQEALGEILGVSKSRISMYEKDENIPERAIRTLAKELHVNVHWLKDGVDPMFLELSRDDVIATYIGKLLSSDEKDKVFQKKFIRVLSRLDINEWRTIEKIMHEFAKEND